MEIIPDKRKLIGLVEQAQRGTLCLPNFQRDFVWSRSEVADLVRSVLRGYFIGSLLLLRCDPEAPPFAATELRGAEPEKAKLRPDWLVLDGQQRLTSMLYALAAPDLGLKGSRQRRWFFIDLNLALTDLDDDEVVFDRSKRELDGLDRQEVQFESRFLPCTRLLRQEDFLTWRDGLEEWLQEWDVDGLKEFRQEYRAPLTKLVTDFQTFEVPLVELPKVRANEPDDIGRVCAIFEKLNSTGVELSVYDLLTARLYPTGVKLHDLWDAACEEHEGLRTWSDGSADQHKFGVLVLRTLALLRDLDPKPRILIDLKAEGFAADWERAAAAVDRALELLSHVGEDGFGVFEPKWLPGFGLLPILAALRARIEDDKLGEGARKDLRRWYWCNVFLERYSSAVESKSRKDYLEFIRYWSAGGDEPAIFSEARARIGAEGYQVRDSASYASAIYSGVFCLLANRGARDWKRGEALALQTLEDHHIFPKAYLQRHGFKAKAEASRVNSIVNRTLISDETNRTILAQAPADYPFDTKVFPSGPGQALLAAHFIDSKALATMASAGEELTSDEVSAAYEKFRTEREALIIAEIRRVCGVSTA